MSDTAPLCVVRLLEELHQVTDWYMLGVYLELPSPELDKIRQQFMSEGVERCKAALFSLWLKNNPNASWELIAVALEKSGEKVSAKQIRVRHLPTPSIPTVAGTDRSRHEIEQSSVTVEVEQAVVDKFTDLEDNFAILVTNIKIALEEKQIPLKSLQRFLEERLEQSGEYMQTTSIDELFQQIRPHYCFLNTTLLKSIVSKFIGEPLQQQLKDYKDQLDEFTTSTKIILLTKDPLIKRIQSQCPPNTEGIPQVVLKLAGCCLNVTIEHFQRLMNIIFRAKDEALTHIRVEDGCICISLLTRESAIPSLVALAQQKVEFMRHVGVLRLTVGDVTILEHTVEEGEDFALALTRAGYAGCTEAVKFILGVDPNYRENECTLLVTASMKGYEKDVRILLEAKADPNLPDIHGQTPLMWACSEGHEPIVNLLLQSGADPNIQTSSGMTALMFADYKSRHLGMFVSLLTAGAAVNAQDEEGWSALMIACDYGCPEIAKLLLDYQADVHLSKSNGTTALMIACIRGHEDIVELLLLASDVSVNAQHTDDESTALMLSCENRYEGIAALLLHSQANPNLQDCKGYTALMLASKQQLAQTVQLLLTSGADPNLQNASGWTALMVSCVTKVSPDPDPSIPLLLLSAGADPNAQNRDRLTALMVAAYHGYESGVRILLNSQADVDTQDIKGNTALHHSARAGHLTITELLLSAGADSSLVDHSGDTAVDITLAFLHPEVCQLLLMHTETKPHPPPENTAGDEGPALTCQMDQLQLSRDTRPPSTIPSLLPIQQLRRALSHPLEPAGTNKHEEHEEEDEDLVHQN